MLSLVQKSFHEITTNEGVSCLSDNEDEDRVQMMFEGMYTNIPISRSFLDPAQRASLLLLDKDFIDSDVISQGACLCD